MPIDNDKFKIQGPIIHPRKGKEAMEILLNKRDKAYHMLNMAERYTPNWDKLEKEVEDLTKNIEKEKVKLQMQEAQVDIEEDSLSELSESNMEYLKNIDLYGLSQPLNTKRPESLEKPVELKSQVVDRPLAPLWVRRPELTQEPVKLVEESKAESSSELELAKSAGEPTVVPRPESLEEPVELTNDFMREAQQVVESAEEATPQKLNNLFDKLNDLQKWMIKEFGDNKDMIKEISLMINKVKQMGFEATANVQYVTLDDKDFEYTSSIDRAKKIAEDLLKKNPKADVKIEVYTGSKHGSGGNLLYTLINEEGKLVKAALQAPAIKILKEMNVDIPYNENSLQWDCWIDIVQVAKGASPKVGEVITVEDLIKYTDEDEDFYEASLKHLVDDGWIEWVAQADTPFSDTKGFEPGAKDIRRMVDIQFKAAGDKAKIEQLINQMAGAITKKDKAIRRAKAAEEVFKGELGKKMAKIFMDKSKALSQVDEIHPEIKDKLAEVHDLQKEIKLLLDTGAPSDLKEAKNLLNKVGLLSKELTQAQVREIEESFNVEIPVADLMPKHTFEVATEKDFELAFNKRDALKDIKKKLGDIKDVEIKGYGFKSVDSKDYPTALVMYSVDVVAPQNIIEKLRSKKANASVVKSLLEEKYGKVTGETGKEEYDKAYIKKLEDNLEGNNWRVVVPRQNMHPMYHHAFDYETEEEAKKAIEDFKKLHKAEIEKAEGVSFKNRSMAKEMALVLFTDAFCSEMENDEKLAEEVGYTSEGQGGVDLTEWLEGWLYDRGLDIDKFVPEKVGQEIIEETNKYWDGKLTLQELAKEFPPARWYVHTTLALNSVGHGVSLHDDPEIDKYMEEKGVDEPPAGDGQYMEIEDAVYDAVNALVQNKGKVKGAPEPKEMSVMLGPDVYQKLTGERPPQAKILKVYLWSDDRREGEFEYIIISYKGSFAAVSADTLYEGVYEFSPMSAFPDIAKLGLDRSKFVNER